MDISRFFIDRPRFAGVLSIIIFLIGLIAIFRLPISEYPEVAPPQIVVRAQFPGANPRVIAEAVAAGRLHLEFLDGPQYRWSELRTETYGELAARLGMPFELIRQTGTTLANRVLSPEDRTREDDEAIFSVMEMVAGMVDVDALTGASVRADGTIEITLPPLFGAVLVSETP